MLTAALFLISLLIVGRAVMDPCQAHDQRNGAEKVATDACDCCTWQPGEIAMVSFPTVVIFPLWVLALFCVMRLSFLLLRAVRPFMAAFDVCIAVAI